MTISEVLKVATVAADSVYEWMTDEGYWPNTDEDIEAFNAEHKDIPIAMSRDIAILKMNYAFAKN